MKTTNTKQGRPVKPPPKDLTESECDKPQAKINKDKAGPFYSEWQRVGAGVEKIIAKSGGTSLNGSHLCAIMLVAIEPNVREIALKDAKARALADTYSDALAKDRKLTMEIFRYVQRIWHHPDPSNTAKVQKFLSTHPFDPEHPEVMVNEMTDGEIEVAAGLAKEKPIAKKARERHEQPKVPMLLITPKLNSAIKYLRTIGFCQLW